MSDDIRWIQRFENYKRALMLLNDAVELLNTRELSVLEKQGVIQAFEFTHELSWKVQRDFLQYRGVLELYGSRDVAREAFNVGLIGDGMVWMEMIKSRNMTSHTYDEACINSIIELIRSDYIMAFNQLNSKLRDQMEKDCE